MGTEDKIREVFGAYGVLSEVKLLNTAGKPDRAALVRMNSVKEAKWLVENLHQAIPLGMTSQVSVRYADNRSGGPKGNGKGMAPANPDNRSSPYEALPTIATRGGPPVALHGIMQASAPVSASFAKMAIPDEPTELSNHLLLAAAAQLSR